MSTKKAFVTGGNGFLGLNLVSLLSAGGWHTTVYDLSLDRLEEMGPENTTLIRGDITDSNAVERSMPEGVDAVFHLAGDTSHWKGGDDRQTRINIGGTRNVVHAALKNGAGRLVYTSSISAFGFQPEPITEETISSANDHWINYFRTKRGAEIEVHRGIESGLDAVIVNPSNIIGPHDYGGWSRMFGLIGEEKLPGAPPGSGSFCHVREAARAHIAAYELGKTGHNYLLGGADATWLEFTNVIAALLGKKPFRRPIPAAVLKTIGRVSYWGSIFTGKESDVTPEKATLVSSNLTCRSDKAIRELGYTPVPLVDMLADCHRRMIENGML